MDKLVEVQKNILSDTGWRMDNTAQKGSKEYIRVVEFATPIKQEEFNTFSKWLKSNRKINELSPTGIKHDEYKEHIKTYHFHYTVE